MKKVLVEISDDPKYCDRCFYAARLNPEAYYWERKNPKTNCWEGPHDMYCKLAMPIKEFCGTSYIIERDRKLNWDSGRRLLKCKWCLDTFPVDEQVNKP